MTVVPIDGDGHAAAQALLPWFVTGTLDADDAAALQAHLAGCERCRGELAFEQTLLVARDAAPLAEVPAPAAGLAALHRRIAAARQQRRLPIALPVALPIALPVAPPIALPVAPPDWWRRAFAAQSAVAAALLLALLLPRGDDTPRYRGLGDATAAAANAVVTFGPGATEAQMRGALAGARVVGGPTATGAWLVLLPDADADALARLRARPGVALAVSLQAGAAR